MLWGPYFAYGECDWIHFHIPSVIWNALPLYADSHKLMNVIVKPCLQWNFWAWRQLRQALWPMLRDWLLFRGQKCTSTIGKWTFGASKNVLCRVIMVFLQRSLFRASTVYSCYIMVELEAKLYITWHKVSRVTLANGWTMPNIHDVKVSEVPINESSNNYRNTHWNMAEVTWFSAKNM